MARPIDADYLMERLNRKKAGPANKRYTEGFNDCLMRVRSMVHSMPTLTPPNEWVSVEERLPEPGERVLAAKGTFVGEAYLASNGAWMRHDGFPWEVDAWMPLPAPPGKGNNVPTNEPLTIEELREMDGEPVWAEDVKHWALIDIEKGGKWDGVPFAIWAENGMKFTYNIKNRGLHCYRRPPEGDP